MLMVIQHGTHDADMPDYTHMIKAALAGRLGPMPQRLARLLRARKPEQSSAPHTSTTQPPVMATDHLLDIPVYATGPDLALQDATIMQGQFLARQERWDELAACIRNADSARAQAGDTMPLADLLTFGARADVVNAVEHALSEHGRKTRHADTLDGISALEDVFAEHPDDYAIALIVALTHIDLGWAWRGMQSEKDLPDTHRAAFFHHFDRAGDILQNFCALTHDSPALAAASCARLAGEIDASDCVADLYEDLIDLDPRNFRNMRALGNHLLPRWFGDLDRLELEARRTAIRTRDIWGEAGYTWVYFDALIHDEAACANVDVEFFVDGLRDILDRRPDQGMANLLAAYCSIAVGQQDHAKDSPAERNRRRIAACADWIVHEHLSEVHPLVWSHAMDGFANNAPVRSVSRFAARGEAKALSVLRDLFADEIARGHRVIFTERGPVIEV